MPYEVSIINLQGIIGHNHCLEMAREWKPCKTWWLKDTDWIATHDTYQKVWRNCMESCHLTPTKTAELSAAVFPYHIHLYSTYGYNNTLSVHQYFISNPIFKTVFFLKKNKPQIPQTQPKQNHQNTTPIPLH